jgi:predicted permease
VIGPVDLQCARALCKSHREVHLPASADEVRIFFNLAMNRAHFSPPRRALYFVDSRHVAVEAIIRAALTGMGVALRTDQLYLDELSIFKSVKRVCLGPAEAAAVLVALRLNGIQITITE